VAGCCVHGYELACLIKCCEFLDSLEPDGFSRKVPRGFHYIASRANVIHGTAPNSLYPPTLNTRLVTLEHCPS
jgi:hypothetical protein